MLGNNLKQSCDLLPFAEVAVSVGKLHDSSDLGSASPRGGTADASDLKSESHYSETTCSGDPKPLAQIKCERKSSVRRAAGHGPWADPRPCGQCGNLFQPTAREVSYGKGKFCSLSCCNKWRAGRASARFTTPESSKAERVRANGLVNMRLRRGHIERPDACQKCGKVGKVDMHHPDYQQPALVAFLCRSCHMKAHHDPDFERDCARLAASMGIAKTPSKLARVGADGRAAKLAKVGAA